jgi:hypothetical protein
VSEVADILRAAADLLEPEGAWTRAALARDPRGRDVNYASPDACSWCAGGAILKIAGDRPLADQVLDFLSQYVRFGHLGMWNDRQTGPEPVLAALRAAAEAAS